MPQTELHRQNCTDRTAQTELHRQNCTSASRSGASMVRAKNGSTHLSDNQTPAPLNQRRGQAPCCPPPRSQMAQPKGTTWARNTTIGASSHAQRPCLRAKPKGSHTASYENTRIPHESNGKAGTGQCGLNSGVSAPLQANRHIHTSFPLFSQPFMRCKRNGDSGSSANGYFNMIVIHWCGPIFG